jgi:chromosome segregation ATPase
VIETIMYAAIGFLSATLLALLTLPAVWRRAVRLTRKRIEAAIPISVAEFQAEKDQLRAEFALETRRHEMDMGELRQRTAEQWAQISRQTEELRVRQIKIDDTSAKLADLETRHAELTSHDRQITDALAQRNAELEAAQANLASTRKEMSEARIVAEQSLARAEEFQVENIALTTLRDTLQARLADLEHHLARTSAMLEEDRQSLRTTSDSLSRAQISNRDLTAKLSLTESNLAATKSQAALVSAELSALRISADLLEKRSATAEKDRDEARGDAERSHGLALSYQRATETAARQSQDQVAMLQAEKSMLEGALAKTREERNALQARLDANLPNTAPGVAAVEDTSLLREKISEVAAEVARITAELEGASSPIVTLLAANTSAKKKIGAPLTLADRIRALQEKAAEERTSAANEAGLVPVAPGPQNQVAAG